MKLLSLLAGLTTLLCAFSSCSKNTLYIPGQEGLESVHKRQQLKGGADINYDNGNSCAHLDISYSPIDNVGVFYDLKTSGLDYQYHTIGLGYYLAAYEKMDLREYTEKKKSIDVGYHFDFYGGASYCKSKDNTFFRSSSFSIADTYGINLYGKRFFGQIGYHLKKEFMSYDIVLRRSWLDIDKIQTFGLAVKDDFNPGKEIQDENVMSYTELSFKVNIGGVYKPLYIGLSRKFGLSNSNVINSTFDHVVGFVGINLDIQHAFGKKIKETPANK